MLLAAHVTGAIEVEPLTWEIAGIFTPVGLALLTLFCSPSTKLAVINLAPGSECHPLVGRTKTHGPCNQSDTRE
jgi:hypothetical protein